MNIQSNTVITDLIHFDEIRVNGTEITLVRDDLTYTFIVEQVTGLRDALNVAIQAAGGALSASLTGPWARMEDIPDTVTTVWDSEDDPWMLDGASTWKERAVWEGRVNRYAPFRAQR